MNKYPCIVESKLGSKALAYSERRMSILDGTYSGEAHDFPVSWFVYGKYKNITAEYLANTYGKIESKEHAELIIKLAENAGFDAHEYHQIGKWFCFHKNNLFFFTEKFLASDNNEKLITIPLPQKSKKAKKEEWPQVGDEVTYRHQSKNGTVRGELLALTKEYAIVQKSSIEQHIHLRSWELINHQTPAEELADILTEITGYQNRQAVLSGAKAIINGEIEGLEYKHD